MPQITVSKECKGKSKQEMFTHSNISVSLYDLFDATKDILAPVKYWSVLFLALCDSVYQEIEPVCYQEKKYRDAHLV